MLLLLWAYWVVIFTQPFWGIWGFRGCSSKACGCQESQPHDDSFSPLADAAEVLAAEAMAEAVERIKAGAESQGMDVPPMPNVGLLWEIPKPYILVVDIYKPYRIPIVMGTLLRVHPSVPWESCLMDGLVGEFWMDFTIQNHQILTTDGSVFQDLLAWLWYTSEFGWCVGMRFRDI